MLDLHHEFGLPHSHPLLSLLLLLLSVLLVPFAMLLQFGRVQRYQIQFLLSGLELPSYLGLVLAFRELGGYVVICRLTPQFGELSFVLLPSGSFLLTLLLGSSFPIQYLLSSQMHHFLLFFLLLLPQLFLLLRQFLFQLFYSSPPLFPLFVFLVDKLTNLHFLFFIVHVIDISQWFSLLSGCLIVCLLDRPVEFEQLLHDSLPLLLYGPYFTLFEYLLDVLFAEGRFRTHEHPSLCEDLPYLLLFGSQGSLYRVEGILIPRLSLQYEFQVLLGVPGVGFVAFFLYEGLQLLNQGYGHIILMVISTVERHSIESPRISSRMRWPSQRWVLCILNYISNHKNLLLSQFFLLISWPCKRISRWISYSSYFFLLDSFETFPLSTKFQSCTCWIQLEIRYVSYWLWIGSSFSISYLANSQWSQRVDCRTVQQSWASQSAWLTLLMTVRRWASSYCFLEQDLLAYQYFGLAKCRLCLPLRLFSSVPRRLQRIELSWSSFCRLESSKWHTLRQSMTLPLRNL